MKRIIYTSIALVAMFLGITFAVRNSQIVQLDYYFDISFSGPLSLVLLATFVIGVVCGYLANLYSLAKTKRRLAMMRRKVRDVEQEVINLRSLPIKDAV